MNDALSAIYSRLNSPLLAYINIQHPSRPITHFRPGKIVTSFIGQILSQFPIAVCSHLWGSLSSSFHLSQHYSSGLPIKMIPVFITLENTGASFPENPILPPVPPTDTRNQTNKTFFQLTRKRRCVLCLGEMALKVSKLEGWGKCEVWFRNINYNPENLYFSSSREQIGK